MGCGDIENPFKFGVAYCAHVHRDNAGVTGELHIGERVSNHYRTGHVYIGKVLKSLHGQSYIGFATGAGCIRQMRAAIYLIKGSTLNTELRLQAFMDQVNILLSA